VAVVAQTNIKLRGNAILFKCRFSGHVLYSTRVSVKCQAQFIEKNNDALHASLAALITESKNPLVKKIFDGDASVQQIGKLTFISIGSKFRNQLGVLMDKLSKTVRSRHTIETCSSACSW